MIVAEMSVFGSRDGEKELYLRNDFYILNILNAYI